jgi:acyl carrier protein
MSGISAEGIRAFVLSRLAAPLTAKRLSPPDVPYDFDLLTEGVIDSLGIVELVTAIQEQFGFEIDFEDLDAEDLTVIGPLCHYIAGKSGGAEKLRT